MYKALWRLFKFPIIVKVILFLLLFIICVALLFIYLFPLIANIIPYPIGNAGVESF